MTLEKRKLLAVVAGVFLSLNFFVASERLYPWLPAIFVICLSIAIYDSSKSPIFSLCLIIFISVIFRLEVFYFPASLIGADTDSYAIWAQIIAETGSTTRIPSGFYQSAPLSLIITAITSNLFDLPSTITLSIYSIIAGCIFPISSYTLSKYITSNESIHVSSAAIATVTTTGIQHSYWPIAQTLSVAYWLGLAIILLITTKYHSTKRGSILIIITSISLVYTHKLAPVILLGSTITIKLAKYMGHRKYNYDKKSPKLNFSILIAAILTLLQWAFITELIKKVVTRISQLLTGVSFSPNPQEQPIAAKIARPGSIGQYFDYPPELLFFFEKSYAVVLLIFGGVGWGLLYRNRQYNNYNKMFILGASAFVTILVGMGILSIDAIHPTRTLFFIEAILSILISISIYEFSKLFPRFNQKLFYTILSLLLISQLFTAVAVPDYNHTPRYYLESEELEARSFGCEYSQRTIRADHYLTQEKYYRSYYNSGNCNSDYKSMGRFAKGTPLYNGTITSQGYSHILLRDVEVYLGTTSRWELQYAPSEILDKEYNKIYAAGGVKMYQS